MKKHWLKLTGAFAAFVLVTVLVLEVLGANMFKPPLYIPEARQPEGFPPPGKVGEIIVKSYPAYRAAVVEKESSNQNEMFGLLFNHIKKHQINMTAPVELGFDDEGERSMAFLYADPELGAVGTDGEVEVVDVPAATVVSIGVRGDFSKQRFENARKQLEQWLSEQELWESAGAPRYFGYNSPMVPAALRYGEVQIPIEERDL